ncbi:MAG: flagellar hook protein FlgE [Methylococcales bacterium]|nr:flagellar hook protein FlgE [Methylococcales bacterium]
MGFATALSGLKGAQTSLSVTGNNIANSQTAGFKESRAQFGDVYTTAMGSKTAVGSGVRVSSVAQQFKQGNIEATGNALDLAISGDGFFALGDLVDPIIPDKPLEATSFTRNGAFHINNAGNVVDDNGRYLLAFKPTGTTVAEGFDVGVKLPLKINTDQGAPTATSAVDMQLNLNGAANVATTPFSFTTPGSAPYIPDPKTYTHTTSITTYDALGNAHIVSTYFAKTAVPNEWDAYTFIDGRSLQPGVQANPYAIPPVAASGAVALPEGTITSTPTRVKFDSNGALAGVSAVASELDTATSNQALALIKLNVANADVVSKQTFLTQAENNVVNAQKAVDAADAAAATAGAVDLTAAQKAAADGLTRAEQGVTDAQLALDTATATADTAQTDYNDAVTTYTDAKAAADQAAADAALAGTPIVKTMNTKIDFGTIDISAIDPKLKATDMTFSLDLASSTQFSTPFTVNDLKQNGLPVGNLTGVDVDKHGVVYAKYSNGFAKPLGQVAMARFPDNQSLGKVGNTTWLATSDSGAPIYGAGGDNNFGTIQSSAIENSNVDLSEQLVKLIVAQQAYQANSQTVTTEKTLIETMLRI